ncbi:MAG: AcrR family transcriptional regulator [Acidimicrobiales bacterium]|jgi:AcrR family transcriptional regulator
MSTPARLHDVASRRGNQSRGNQSGEQTKERIIDAALATVSQEGLIGTSARAIARTGDFNQALVFYHFGSVDELLLASLERANERRMGRFRERLEEVDDLPGLVRIATDLHGTRDDPDVPALSAIVAGWSASSGLGPQVIATLQPWNDLVAGALKRAFGDSPFAAFLPTDQLAHALSAMFLGIEMLARLDPDDSSTQTMFASLGALANLAGPIIANPPGSESFRHE